MGSVLGLDRREPSGDERSLQILVIDPDPATASIVHAVFENAHVRDVADVYCGLNELSMERADVIITELCLPGAGVVELLRRLQVTGNLVPVVVLSHARGSAASLRSLGVSAILAKPVRAAELAATVLCAVESSARHVEVFRAST